LSNTFLSHSCVKSIRSCRLANVAWSMPAKFGIQVHVEGHGSPPLVKASRQLVSRNPVASTRGPRELSLEPQPDGSHETSASMSQECLGWSLSHRIPQPSTRISGTLLTPCCLHVQKQNVASAVHFKVQVTSSRV
jgi:hypothetical protein